MMSSIFLMSHDLFQPIRTGSEKAQKETDDATKECPHSVGVWTLKTNLKKLQFVVEKCHQLHFGGKKNLCPDLHIINCGVKKSNEAKTGFANLVNDHLGDHKLKDVEEEKYLGDIISTNGSNLKNILSRK